jgi:hypothetical protein
MLLKGFSKSIQSFVSSVFKPASFRLAAQCLKHYATARPDVKIILSNCSLSLAASNACILKRPDFIVFSGSKDKSYGLTI